MDEVQEVKAEFFATISKGKIVTLGQATPPQTLIDCQIILSKEEFRFLESVKGMAITEIIRLAKVVAAKIKANEEANTCPMGGTHEWADTKCKKCNQPRR